MIDPDTAALIEDISQAEDHTLNYRPSAPLDRFIWLEHEGLDQLVQTIATQIDALSVRRQRDVATEEKYLFAIKCLILNLLKISKFARKTLQAVPKGAEAYSVNTRYDQKLTAYRSFIEVYEGLESLGYIREVSKGRWDKEKKKGEVTRIEATRKLLAPLETLFPQETIIFIRHPSEESIILRSEKGLGGKKKPLDYSDNDFTNKARASLAQINACLMGHWYDLDLTNEGFKELAARQIERHKKKPKKPPFVDYSSRSLYRVFSNGDFEQGGRFYGGWWEGIPSEYRKYITIDGKWTVELDYSNLHPFMLYAKEGLAFPGDAYAIEGVKDRDMVKIAFAKLLNGKKRLDKPKDYDLEAVGMEWKSLLAAVEVKHKPIAKYFRTGYGNVLMHLDSQVAERIMLNYAERNIPCLPVHDSFIVHHAYADELKALMLDEYRREMGAAIGIKMDNNFDCLVERHIEAGGRIPPVSEIFQILQQSQYEKRWVSWVSQTQ